MSRAIMACFHVYTGDFGKEYFNPLLSFFLNNLRKYKDEYDQIYLIDSNWNIPSSPDYKILGINPSTRYYDAYKELLPMVAKDSVLTLDSDMVIYRKGKIDEAFKKIEEGYDIASIFDSIGNHPSKEFNGKTKVCPYWFCFKKDYLMNFRNCDWGPNMPEWETLGKLSMEMAKKGVKAYEFEEDKSSIYIDGRKDPEKGKDLGYYHIRAGSVPAVLLAWKKHRPETYRDYIDHQPKNEYLRQCAWYQYMGGNPYEIVKDVTEGFEFKDYYEKFLRYHNLP